MQYVSHTMTILIELLEGKGLTASDKNYSNTNQYFSKIKKRDIELVELKIPNKHNSQIHYKRFLAKSDGNIQKAKDYLKYLATCNSWRKNKK